MQEALLWNPMRIDRVSLHSTTPILIGSVVQAEEYRRRFDARDRLIMLTGLRLLLSARLCCPRHEYGGKDSCSFTESLL